jgi:rubrerythrin
MGSGLSVEMFSDMSDKEKIYAEALLKLSEKVKHPVLRAVFLAISQDSLKHSLLYRSLVEFLSSVQPALTQEEYKAVIEEVDKHIETEAQMIRIARETLEKVDDPRIKLILSAILNDEVEHHKVLVDIKDKLAKIEFVSEEDLWNSIWRDSPWHGTPGG